MRAAQLRARVVRFGLGQSALGTLFLIGALTYPLGPAAGERSSILWTAALVVISTFHIAMGLRALARARKLPQRSWLPLSLAWGGLAAVLMKLLLSR